MAAEARVSRWYFGGLASCGAACCTHPLDLLKVHLQTQQEVKLRMTGMALQVVRSDGVLALYNGLSASLCRQMTYSLTRFAIYESVRDHVTTGSQGPLPFYKKVLLGSISGCIGGFVGTPADMVNVRMQNDVKLEPSQRRNYAHALDGLYRVAREEGLRKLFSGASMAASRGMFVTVGQVGLLLALGFGQPRWCHCGPPFAFPRAGGPPPGPDHPCTPAAVLLRSGQAAGPQHRVPGRQHLHSLCRQLHRGWMCHGPVSAPRRPEDPPDELQGRVQGCVSLRCRDSKARAAGLLQGPRACRHPPHAAHRAHVCLPGTASQTLWPQSALLTGPRSGLSQGQPPAPGSSRVGEGRGRALLP
ncbi:mitochondrial dicarboxylate carrier isoform X1 [Leopardus geoffroyi]|uniref:mitochondrial dicarboxylate carrier isoform X1 n=1 Tax=Leopardus geoffroyi TaxID=46844 RepID=UPI001E26597D|nr:mitochondrial dicarboxylate carrier isoform X1 [Leopardus geoffroyi]